MCSLEMQQTAEPLVVTCAAHMAPAAFIGQQWEAAMDDLQGRTRNPPYGGDFI